MVDPRPTRRTAPTRFVTRLRARGVQEVAGLVGKRAREWVASRGELVMHDADPATVAPRDVRGTTVRSATANDAPRYARDVGTDSVTSFRARLTDRTRCFIVEIEGRLVHATWFTTGAAWTREIAAYVIPPSRHGYVYESFTHPDARGRGIYPVVLSRICQVVADEGCPRIWVGVESVNTSSRRAIEKAGFEAAYSIVYERRFGSVKHRIVGKREQPMPRISPHPA